MDGEGKEEEVEEERDEDEDDDEEHVCRQHTNIRTTEGTQEYFADLSVNKDSAPKPEALKACAVSGSDSLT